jgi:hypothetical protein
MPAQPELLSDVRTSGESTDTAPQDDRASEASAEPKALEPASGADEEQAAERRQAPRFTLLIQTAKLVSHHGEFLCIVRDASSEGVRIRHFGFLPPDEFIEFELANGQRFTVQLAWKDEEYAGLKFNKEVNLGRIVKLASSSLPRRQLRLATEIVGKIKFADLTCPVTIRNLSQQGACIECVERIAVEQLIRLEGDLLDPVYAKVRWRKGTVYGLVFEDTLTLERLAEIVAQAAYDEAERMEREAQDKSLANDR